MTETFAHGGTWAYLGVRELRCIMGDYVLNVADFNNRASFADEIGRFSYPVDIHIMTPGKAAYDTFCAEHRDMRYKDGESGCFMSTPLLYKKTGDKRFAVLYEKGRLCPCHVPESR